MKRDCSTCIYKEGSCYPSKTIFDKDKTCYSYNPDYEGYISDLEKENAELKKKCYKKAVKDYCKLEKENARLKEINTHTLSQLNLDNGELIIENEKLKKENAELKARVGLSIECDKAQENGGLCLGYGGDEDEPCEQCKNCIKCECGYYQLGETEKDEELIKAKEILHKVCYEFGIYNKDLMEEAKQFLKETE